MGQQRQRRRPIVERVANTSIGRFAEGVHKNTISSWPFGVRMTIAVLWDFLVDTPLRIVAWFIPLPFVVEVIRFPLDVILALGALMLWGSPGLLQTGGIVLGFIPIVGRAIDLLPILTIAGFIARRRGHENMAQQNETPEASQISLEDSTMIVVPFLTGLVGLVLGLILWWNGAIDFTSIIWVTLCPAGAAFMLRLARMVPIPRQLLISVGVIAGALLLLDTIVLGFFGIWWTPESYRRVAWQELQKETSFALLVKTAKAADSVGKAINAKDLAGAGGSLATQARNRLADFLEGKKSQEHEEEPPEMLAGSEDEESSKSRRIAGWLGQLVRSEPPKKDVKSAEQKADLTAIQKDAARLGFGHMQSRLYASDTVLEKAQEIRSTTTSWLWTAAMWLAGILGFVVIFGLLQNQEQNRERIEPEIPF